jgi:hypothetical protein
MHLKAAVEKAGGTLVLDRPIDAVWSDQPLAMPAVACLQPGGRAERGKRLRLGDGRRKLVSSLRHHPGGFGLLAAQHSQP